MFSKLSFLFLLVLATRHVNGIPMFAAELTALRQFQSLYDCRADWCLRIKYEVPDCPIPGTNANYFGLKCEGTNGYVTEV
jgi:hypothetical protein